MVVNDNETGVIAMAMTFKDYTTEYKGRVVRTDSKEDMMYLYIEERLSTTEIAKVFDNKISNKTIARRLHKLGITPRDSKGENNASWRGGIKMTKDGYKLIHQPDHPSCNSQGYVLEHRLVMESVLKRYLKETELVHHINKNRLDNRPENLALMDSNSEHAKLENSFRKRDKFGRYI